MTHNEPTRCRIDRRITRRITPPTLLLALAATCWLAAFPAASEASNTGYGPVTCGDETLGLVLLDTHDIGDNFSPDFEEASGLSISRKDTRLVSIGDDQETIYKMHFDGAASKTYDPKPASGVGKISHTDFEGITYAGIAPSGESGVKWYYIAMESYEDGDGNEQNNGILPFDYDAKTYQDPVLLSSMTNYSTVSGLLSGGSNKGLEGITFDPGASLFYALVESGLVIQINASLTTIEGHVQLDLNDGDDASGLAYDEGRGDLWVISDEGQRIYLFDYATQEKVCSFPFFDKDGPVDNGEGIAYRKDGDKELLYVVTDEKNGKSTEYIYSLRPMSSDEKAAAGTAPARLDARAPAAGPTLAGGE